MHLGCQKGYLREGEYISIHCIFSKYCGNTDYLIRSVSHNILLFTPIYLDLNPLRAAHQLSYLATGHTWMQMRFMSHMIS